MPHQREVVTIDLDGQGVTTQANTTGEFSAIVDIEVPAGYRYEFPSDHGIEMYAFTHESFTVSASSTETKSLSNDLVNSPALTDVETSSAETAVTGPRSLTVWSEEEDAQVGVDSVDYDANEFDYTDSDATDEDLQVWYLWGDSAQVEFRQYTPDEETYEKQLIQSMRGFHSADVFHRPSRITFPEPFTMLEKEHLKLTVKTDVDLTNWDVRGPSPSSSPGSTTTYGFSDISIPVRKIPMRA